MKLLWRLGKEAVRYRTLYLVAVLATLLLTAVNLTAPKVLSSMTAVVEGGMSEAGLSVISGLTLLLLALYLLRVLFRFLSNYLAHKAAWNLVGDMRMKVYNKLQRCSLHFFHDKQTGDLLSRLISDTAYFELLYAHVIPEMITNLVTVTGVLVILLSVNWRLALLTCCPVPFILLAGVLFTKKVRPNFKRAQEVLGETSAKLQDNLSGIHEIQAFVQEDSESAQVKEHVFEHVHTQLHALRLSAIFHPGVEFLSAVGTVIVVGVGGLLALHGQLSVADIVAFLLYLSLFYTPISGLARLLEDMQTAYAGAVRVMAILDAPEEITDAENAVELRDVRGDIAFDHVSFHYQNGVPVLQDISFSCRAGQMIALVGPTGVGKTTLTQLIGRFYEPSKGVIRLDGQDIAGVTLHSLRRHIAPVLQDTFLFNGSIADNIAYSRPSATRDEVIAAARAAHIHEDVLAMPQQYETQVGERGLRLSGGQKQRIAIARAILNRAPVIVLDEATASVDVETEREIQTAIAELAGTRTIVAIAHRLSTIRRADCILVLDGGRIVESGTHDELMAHENGLYRRLNLAQSAE